MAFRKHQKQFDEVIDGIIQGSGLRKSYIHATPGAGKSAIPIIAGKLITAGLADAIAWVVPRLTLGYQAETNFLDPFFRDMVGHNLTIRAATNEVNPCRGQNGFVTTYQAVGVDEKRTVLRDFSTKRYILVLDEWHHCELDGPWHVALAPIVDKAEFLIFMTGTLQRGDEKPIAWTPYDSTRDGLKPRLTESCDDYAAIRYTRTDALREKAILPVHFYLYDGQVSWEKKTGEKVQDTITNRYKDVGEAIYTAIETEFAEDLLRQGLNHWRKWKAGHPTSKLLVVTANIKHAKKINKLLGKMGFYSEIATSEDSKEAIRVIKKYKYGALDILVSVAMIYEGFDCKPLTHIVCLTHIRSEPWIEQMIARAVRIDPEAGPYENQKAFVFAPDDFLFRGVVSRIRAEQLPIAKESMPQKKKANGNGEPEPGIKPLNSHLTGSREIDLSIPLMESAIPDGKISQMSLLKTISEQETELREQIDKHVREYSFKNRYKAQRIHSEIKDLFRKGRAEMTLTELKRTFRHIEQAYPLNGNPLVFRGNSPPRGNGVRVSTKAVPWP